MSTFGAELWLFIIVGIVVPLVIFTMMLTKKVGSKAMFTTATICIIAGSFFIKHIVIYLGQMV